MIYDTDGLTDTDIAALRGLGGPNDAEIAQLRATRDGLIAQIQSTWAARPDLRAAAAAQGRLVDTKAANLVELRAVVQRLQSLAAWIAQQPAASSGSTPPPPPDGSQNAAEIAQLRATRDGLIAQIQATWAARPDLRAAAAAQGRLVDTKAANLVELRAVVQRLQSLAAWIAQQPAAGSGGTPPPASGNNQNAAEIAQLRATRDALIEAVKIAWQTRPDLRAAAAAQGRLVDTKAANLVELRAVVQRLQALVAWIDAQPERTPAAAPQPAPVAVPAPRVTADWTIWSRVGAFLSAPTWGRPPTGVPARRWGSSSLPCGMGSWLSKAFKRITGQNLSSVVAPIANQIPVVGGIVSNIVAGGATNAGQVVQQVAQAVGLTQQQVADIAAGKPCASVSAEKRAQCQAEVARIADALRAKYKAAAGAAPCAHLPATLKVQCQNERRAAWEQVVQAINRGQTPPPAAFAALTPAEQQAVSAAASSAAGGVKLSAPLALGAAGLALLALGGRR